MGKHVAPGTWVPDESTRKWVFGIIGALVPVLITLEVLTTELADGVLSIAAAVLAVGGSALAGVNVRNPVVDDEPVDES